MKLFDLHFFSFQLIFNKFCGWYKYLLCYTIVAHLTNNMVVLVLFWETAL